MTDWITWALQAMIIGGVGIIWFKIENTAKDLTAFRLKYAEEGLTKEDFKPYKQLIHDFRDYLQQEKGKTALREQMQKIAGG